MEKKKMKLRKKILIILAVIVAILIMAYISYKMYLQMDMDRRYNEFEKVQAMETKGTLTYVEDENYAKAENMDYVTQDGIGVKINSISIDDSTFSAKIQFKFDKQFDYKTFGYSYVLYDENKNIYEISSRQHIGELEKYDYASLFMQRELGIDKRKDIYSPYLAESGSMGNEVVDENTAINEITINAKDNFPLSQKIYIKIFDLGYYTIDKDENGEYNSRNAKNTNLSNAKWLFEFDIPEAMNKRETINLKLASEIPGLTMSRITLTDTKLVMNFESEEYMNLISEGKDMLSGEFMNKCKEMLNVTDAEGNMYKETGGGTTGEKNSYKVSIDATKKDLVKKLFVNFKVGDKQKLFKIIDF